MCTVAFVPLPSGGYLLGHNRDESRARARGLPPELHAGAGRAFLAPLDPDGGGTWIGVHDGGVTMCVLNAAEPDPSRLPPVPRSRGLVLRDLLPLDGAGALALHLESEAARGALRDVRAFHIVAAEPGRGGRPARSARLCWNGTGLAFDRHEGPRLYVSSSLDQDGAERERGRSWRRLLGAHPLPDAGRVRAWLASHEPERGPLSVCMHRPEARTVSRTLVTVAAGRIELAYLDGSPCEASSQEVVLTL
jgi:hypothetical protein